MGDMDRAVTHVRQTQNEGREISDACARVIGAMFHNGQASLSYSFTSTGAVPEDTSALWRDMFPRYQDLLPVERLLADMLGTYLLVHRGRDSIAGWSELWL